MQKKIWYYEKWGRRHASFPPRPPVKDHLELQNPPNLDEGSDFDVVGKKNEI